MGQAPGGGAWQGRLPTSQRQAMPAMSLPAAGGTGPDIRDLRPEKAVSPADIYGEGRYWIETNPNHMLGLKVRSPLNLDQKRGRNLSHLAPLFFLCVSTADETSVLALNTA